MSSTPMWIEVIEFEVSFILFFSVVPKSLTKVFIIILSRENTYVCLPLDNVT